MKSRFLHCGLGFGIFHEGVPNEAAAMIFRHQHGDAKVDAQHVRDIPAAKWIESIDETVLLPHAFPVRPAKMAQHADAIDETVLLPHAFPVRPAKMAQHADAIVEEKRKRASGRAWHDASIDRPKRPALNRRTAPRGIALYVIRSTDSPKILAVVGETVAQRQTKEFVRFGCLHGIFKIIRIGVALVPEIKPGLRILMRENRIVAGNV